MYKAKHIETYVTRHDISRLMEVKRHNEKKTSEVALQNRAPVNQLQEKIPVDYHKERM